MSGSFHLKLVAALLAAAAVSCNASNERTRARAGSADTAARAAETGAVETAGGGSAVPASGPIVTTEDGIRLRIETVAEDLVVPWSIAFAPDGRIFFTERPGRVRVIGNDGVLHPEPVAEIEDASAAGEGGLMGLTLHPQFGSNHLLYVAYMYRDRGRSVRVVRYREADNRLVEPRTMIENIPAAQFHAGCRLRFGPDGKLYITTGDATERPLAQKLSSLAGKTLRLNDDGSVPDDNPFVGRSGARPEIWSYGHRNSQGLDWHPDSGLMFQTEHGPSGFDGGEGGDEVNLVERGKNYGWPVVHHEATRRGMESPLALYTPAVAPASALFYRGNLIPAFRGNLFFGGLVGEVLMRLVVDGRRIVRQEPLLHEDFGRIREVAEGPDGALYISTSNRDGRGSPDRNDDRILKLVPVK